MMRLISLKKIIISTKITILLKR